MTVLRSTIRPGRYYDSVVLMQLQRALAALPGVVEAGVVMATETNRELLAAGSLLPAEVAAARADDLLVVVRGESAAAAEAALGKLDELLHAHRLGFTHPLTGKPTTISRNGMSRSAMIGAP